MVNTHPPSSKYLAERCMRSSLRTTALWVMTCFLASCGGGGDVATPLSSSQTSCGFSLKYADGGTSGRPINLIASVETQPIAQCTITTLTSVIVDLCLKDVILNELSAKLIQPNHTEINLNLAIPTSGLPSCLTGGTRYTVVVPVSSISETNGHWGLSITDTDNSQNNIGFLIGWSFQLTGNR